MTEPMSQGLFGEAHVQTCRCGRQLAPLAMAGHQRHHPECRPTFEERFWSHVVVQPGCWGWTGGTVGGGYGSFRHDGVNWRGNRASWVIHFGPIPDGMDVLHRCDNPPCTNPADLFLGTNADNVADMIAKGRKFIPPTLPLRPRVVLTAEQRAERQVRGERHPQAKLTIREVETIRRRYAAGGVLQRELAAEFGVSQVCISDIVHRRYWA